MILALLKRAAGFGPMPEPVIEAECHREIDTVLTFAFPPLSIIEKERQAIAIKRERLTVCVEDFDAAISFHEGEAERYRADKASTLRILAGLEKHEAEIAEPTITDANSAADLLRSHRRRKPILAAAE